MTMMYEAGFSQGQYGAAGEEKHLFRLQGWYYVCSCDYQTATELYVLITSILAAVPCYMKTELYPVIDLTNFRNC